MQTFRQLPALIEPLPVMSAQRLAVMVAKIGCIIFVVEFLIMFALYGIEDSVTVLEGALDATILTLVASPLIYAWVARPFAAEAAAAREKLTLQLKETQMLLGQNVRLKDSLQEFTAASADIHERTLQRIGADLHDGPAQSLTFSLLHIDRLLRALDRSDTTTLNDNITELRRVIYETSHEIRGISTDLALPELRAMSLREVVELAVHRHRMTTGGAVSISFQTAAVVTQMQKACIYRVVQESLSNASKHGKAHSIEIAIQDCPGLTVTITDRGSGFDPNCVVNKGLGLLGMRARVEALRGRFEVRSSPSQGTTVIATFDEAASIPGADNG
jgi:signal transduction histidine kinase